MCFTHFEDALQFTCSSIAGSVYQSYQCSAIEYILAAVHEQMYYIDLSSAIGYSHSSSWTNL